MKKIWLYMMFISIFLLASFFIYNNIKTKNNVKEIFSNSWISEEEKEELIKNLDKKDIDDKISSIKKKIKLKWLITKANMYYDNNEYMIALIEYQKVLKNIPNDNEVNLKVWDIYYKIHKYKKANEHYEKVKNETMLDKQKVIFSLINDKWISKENIEELNNKIDSLKLNEEENFYYKNWILCVVDYSLCRKNFQDLFAKKTNFSMEEMNVMYKSFEAFKNFKDNDLYYKAAFVTWWFYQNWFYYVTLKTSENILKQKNDYKPVMRMAAKSSYEIWDYISAKKYLTKIRETDKNDPEVSYFLARVYEKLNDKVPALINYQKAIKDWYEDLVDIKRRIIFIYFDSKEYKKMLKEFDELLNINSEKINENDYSLAIYYNIVENNNQKAKNYIQRAIRKFKESEIFYWYLAWIMLQKEELSNIELKMIKANIEKAKKIPNKNPLIPMVNWIYELKTKNYNNAILNLRSALSLDKSWEYKEVINLWLEQAILEKNYDNNN